MLGVTLRWTGIPPTGEWKHSWSLHVTETGINSGLMNHLARMQTWCCSESKTQGKPKAKYALPKPILKEKRFHTAIKIILTLESRIFQPPRETKIGFKNRLVQEIRGKFTVFDKGGETTFGQVIGRFVKTKVRENGTTLNMYATLVHSLNSI